MFKKKWVRHKVKSYIYCVNQSLRETCHKKWNQECKSKQYFLFNLCNIFDHLTFKTEKIAWWTSFFKSFFLHIFLSSTTQENLKKLHRQIFIVSYLGNILVTFPIRNIFLSKLLRAFCLPLRNLSTVSWVSTFSSFHLDFLV